METLSEWQAEERYSELLDEIYGTVKIAGYEYGTSYALKNLDPVAYRTGLLDWADAEGIEIE